MTLRVMKTDDYDGALSLWSRTEGMRLNDYDDSREGIGRFLSRNPGTCFVAEEEGAIVGVLLCGHDGRRADRSRATASPSDDSCCGKPPCTD